MLVGRRDETFIKNLVGKLNGRELERPRFRCKGKTRLDVRGIGRESVD
jgi:hypothetical protein